MLYPTEGLVQYDRVEMSTSPAILSHQQETDYGPVEGWIR
jgi:hypothetical protein